MRISQTKVNLPAQGKYAKPVNEIYRVEFDDWSEMLDYTKTTAPKAHLHEARDNDSWREKWAGGSFEACVKLAHDGWEQGAAKIQTLGLVHFEKLCSKIEQYDPIQDVTGLCFDVALVVQHVPECWQRMEIIETEGAGNKVVRINFNATVSGGISTEVMFARGAAIFALIELLELAGTRVELSCDIICTNNWGAGKQIESTVLVKPADQPLDAARLAFALCHAGFLRRLGFALYEFAPADFQVSGYGHPANSETSKGAADIYIGRGFLGEPDWQNQNSARNWILATLKAQGIEVAE